MQGESGEVGNVVKKLRRAEVGLRGVLDGDRDDLLAKLAEEIADTYLYLDLLATYYGIDVPSAVIAKFNAVSELQGLPERLP
jgi:NTP pyrophosphatase (non-canonical NTP hydrolase)